jgi:hypothetical protein
MAENRTSLTFGGIEIAAAKDRYWHVEAGGRSAAARFLDQALEKVMPHLTNRQRDALMIKLLTLTHPWQPREKPALAEAQARPAPPS